MILRFVPNYPPNHLRHRWHESDKGNDHRRSEWLWRQLFVHFNVLAVQLFVLLDLTHILDVMQAFGAGLRLVYKPFIDTASECRTCVSTSSAGPPNGTVAEYSSIRPRAASWRNYAGSSSAESPNCRCSKNERPQEGCQGRGQCASCRDMRRQCEHDLPVNQASSP